MAERPIGIDPAFSDMIATTDSDICGILKSGVAGTRTVPVASGRHMAGDLPQNYRRKNDGDSGCSTRLRSSGVTVAPAIAPGAPHGFNGLALGAAVSKRANASIRMAPEHAQS